MPSFPLPYRQPSSSLLPVLEKLLQELLASFEFSSFALGISYPRNLSEARIAELKKELQGPLTRKLEEQLGKKIDFSSPQIEIQLDFHQGKISLYVRPVYLLASYNKFSRSLTQTKDYCYHCKGRGCKECNGEGVLSHESVEELIAKHAVPLFGAQGAVFHGAGREDKDVRMLGSGRPFVLEIAEPMKRTAGLAALEQEINAIEKEKIQVHGLSFCEKKKIAEVKETRHEKVYEALVETDGEAALASLVALQGKKFDIKQQTPGRVAYRRADKVREHWVIVQEIKQESDQSFRVRLHTSAGLYIKEFISGEEGNTVPSLSALLGVPCRCRELDVMEILQE